MLKKIFWLLCVSTFYLHGSMSEMKKLKDSLGYYPFLKEVGAQTMQWYQVHKGEISKFDPNGSMVYNQAPVIPNGTLERSPIPVIEVVNKDSFAAARDILLSKDKDYKDKVAVLNFANEVSPGGGFLGGAAAQEESLCRQSTLYEALVIEWQKVGGGVYVPQAGAIYTPNVYVFRNGRDEFYSYIEQTLGAKPFYVNVITSAAENLNKQNVVKGFDQEKYIKDNAFYISKLTAKIRAQINIAIVQGNLVFVAGAYGCGAFNNLPEIVSRVYYNLLVTEGLGKYFDKVVFAILADEEKVDNNFIAFQERFKGWAGKEKQVDVLESLSKALQQIATSK